MNSASSPPASRPPGPSAGKAAWRHWAKALRGPGVPAEVTRATTDGIIEWLSRAGTPEGIVVIYLPLPDEVDVTAMTDRVDRAFAVTRTPSLGDLTLHPADCRRERHRYGFEQPVANAPRLGPGAVGIVLVPGLAFDRQGGRLGRGGGYYDRFLPTVPAGAPRVGVAPERLIVDILPTDSHDVPMTHLATEGGVRSVERRP